MTALGDSFLLDTLEVSVADTYSITEPGEDGDTWEVHQLQDEAGRTWLFVEEGEELTLYRPVDPATPAPTESITWDYDLMIKLSSAVHGKRGKLRYATGDSPDDRSFLLIDDQTWEMDDYVLHYGPDDAWLARATTPAAQLSPFDLPAKCEPPKRVDIVGWILLGLFALWGVASMLIGKPLGFDWGYWIAGSVLITITTFGHGRRPRLSFSASFGLFLLSAFVLLPLVGSLLPPTAAAPALALFWLVLMAALSWIWHRGFYVIGDSATKAGFTSLLTFTIGLLAVAVFDEDFSWLGNWWWYFRAAPWAYIWPAIFVAWLIYVYYDYRDVPLSERGFGQLRGRVVRHLASQSPLTASKRIGNGADDLADALHLSADPRVRALAPYRDLLQEIARVFRALDSNSVVVPSVGSLAEHIQADTKLLSEELAQMSSAGKGMRISPLLRFITGSNPEAGDFLETLKGRQEG